MKTVKLFVLLLAFALLCTLAAAFTDDEDIGEGYSEAVAAMAERGVLEGFEDGSFRPEESLTREQGAKIIAYLCLGEEAAEALVCNKAPFDDVAADRWSAPYIAWCVEKGIINGYGNGCFGPTDALTGDHYAKMLLCALGLGREDKTAYTGPDWFKAVREDAEAAGLYDGDPAMASAKPLNRGQAALLSWNSAQTVETAAASPSPSPTAGPDTGSGSGSSGGSGGSGGAGGAGGGGTAPSPSPSPSPSPEPSPEPSPSTEPSPSPSPAPGGDDNTLPEIPIK